jgi:hypothetical protein
VPSQWLTNCTSRRADSEYSSYGLVRFAIEPPIEVHDPKFLEEAVMATPGNKWAFGDFDLVNSVGVNFSDHAGTYGSMEVHSGVPQEKFQNVVTTAFRSGLEVGNTALSLSFPEEQ